MLFYCKLDYVVLIQYNILYHNSARANAIQPLSTCFTTHSLFDQVYDVDDVVELLSRLLVWMEVNVPLQLLLGQVESCRAVLCLGDHPHMTSQVQLVAWGPKGRLCISSYLFASKGEGGKAFNLIGHRPRM